jgi:hypothetical protein
MNMPSIAEINRAAAAFDKEDRADGPLQKLFAWAKGSADYDSVLLKVVALNRLYSTNVYAVYEMADHISSQGAMIDRGLEAGDPSVVDLIAKFSHNGVARNHFSFATKYCSFHAPDKYPIYDSNVYRTLMALARGENRKSCISRDDCTYAEFRSEIDRLRAAVGSADVPYKTLDKFLYRRGLELSEGRTRTADELGNSTC